MADRLKLNVPGKPEYVGTIRLAASHVASTAGFDIEAIEDIKVAISEACTNIICHAHEDPDFTYDVILELDGNELAITAEDKGMGFEVDNYVEPNPDAMNEGGLGLFIIKTLMDEVDIRSKSGVGTTIRMVKHMHSEAF